MMPHLCEERLLRALHSDDGVVTRARRGFVLCDVQPRAYYPEREHISL